MPLFNERERRALTYICETLIPELPTEQSEKDVVLEFAPTKMNLVNRLDEAYDRVTSDSEKRELKLLLSAFENNIFNGITAGQWRSFSKMTFEQRENTLAKWADSSLFVQRKAFQSLKRLIMFVAYTNLEDDSPHPVWKVAKYPGPVGGGDPENRLHPMIINQPQTLETDVLIVGSGAGGGVVAGELSEAGYDVIVVEKGGNYNEGEFDGNELRGNELLYEKYGALASEDKSIMIMAGSTLGGGTTVNWSASLRTPDYVLDEWKREYGFDAAVTDDFQNSLDSISQRMNVSTAESHVNANNHMLEVGCKAMNYHVDVIPRNVKGCEDCGFCSYGCSFGGKQGTAKTYLQDLQSRGGRIIVKADVRRVLHENGQATGAEVHVTDEQGHITKITIRAKIVVVSAGSIHTPAVLKRSGLTNPHIGNNLKLHPVTAIFGIFDNEIQSWHGVPMSRYSKEFSNLDGKGYGTTLEVAPTHPGLYALAFPWRNARHHKMLISQMGHIANIIVLTRDYHGGRITVDKNGQPQVHYRLHDYDRKHLMQGVIGALRIYRGAGATKIFSPHNDVLVFDNENETSDSAFEAYLNQVETKGLVPNAYPLFSAHQMASSRIAGSPDKGALKPTGETWEIKNLFVADGSALPTASGVNPMLTIMATSHHIAQHIKAQLN